MESLLLFLFLMELHITRTDIFLAKSRLPKEKSTNDGLNIIDVDG